MSQSNEQIKDGVVSIFDPKDFEIEWRIVPELNNIRVSSIGTVNVLKSNEWVIIKPIKDKINKIKYFVINVNGKFYNVHRLICFAFHGYPPNSIDNYVVNHKDGNKHNNLPSNLEWITHSDNMYHALINGMRNDNIKVHVKDMVTGEWKEYYSIIELSRQFNMPRNDVKKLISRHRIKPWNNRYLFSIDFDNLNQIKRDHHDKIKAFDYVEQIEINTDNASSMDYKTGVHASTILSRIGKKGYIVKDKDAMIAGFVFKLETDDSDWPEHSIEDAIESRESYFNRKQIVRNVKVLVKNYVTDTIIKYECFKEVAKLCNVNYATLISEKERLFDKQALFKGLVFKYEDDNRPWPDYSKEYAEHTLYSKRPHIPPVEVYDAISDTTKLYLNKKEFAEGIGLSTNALNLRIQNKKEGILNDRYHFKIKYLRND